MIEVIRWISIICLWIVTGCMIVVMIRMVRLSKTLDKQVDLYKVATDEMWAARDKYYNKKNALELERMKQNEDIRENRDPVRAEY